MIKSGEKLKELAVVLGKQNNLLVSEAINQLREEQPFEGAIGLLTSCYNRNDDHLVRKTIEGFMNDIKDLSARKEVIHEIRKEWKPATISMLVSSCWQSGLDYSQYYMDIARIFVNCDYVTAIECLTVIEESVPSLSRASIDEIIRFLEEKLKIVIRK